MVLRQPLENGPSSETDENDELIAKNKDYRYVPERMTWDPNCYECKVRYRDPKAKDLVMYLHAWRYKVSVNVMFVVQYWMQAIKRRLMPSGLLFLSIVGARVPLHLEKT